MHARWNTIEKQDDIFWRRPLRGWELESLQHLGHVINSVNLSYMEDSLNWKVYGGDYTTSQGYELLQGRGIQETHWLLIWKFDIPPKVKIFVACTARTVANTRGTPS